MISVMNSNVIDLDRNPSASDDNKNVLSEEIRDFNGDDRLGSKASDSYQIRVSKDGSVEEVGSLKEIDEKFSDGNGGSEQNESKGSVRKGKSEKLGTKSKKGSGKREKGEKEEKGSSVSQYDSMLSMFDEFAANGGGGTEVGLVGHRYEVGDMVWGKVKSHPWWPGHVYSEEFASQSVRRSKTEENVLVAFFGDSSYGWFDLAELVPFDSNFAEKSRQTSSRTFVKAVEEAVDEANRRRALGLACRCRDEFNFGDAKVPGYFAVDIPNYEPGTIYSVDLIRKSRDSFQPGEMLDFVKKLALSPTCNEHGSIHFMKNKATAVAYRTVVYDEFDETYAQAFGHQPVRPSKQTQDVASTRVPLSGPLVIAEALGKAKGAARPHKSKDQTKKDGYIFKRRDEPNELKPSDEILQDQGTPSGQQVYVDGSLPIASGDYILPKRSPSVSSKNHDITVKLERPKTVTGDSVSDLGHQATGKEGMTINKKLAVVEFSKDGVPGQLSHSLEARSSVGKRLEDMPCTVDVSRVATDLDDYASSTISKPAECFVQSQAAEIKLHGEPSQDAGVTAAPLPGTAEAKVRVEGPKVRAGYATKKTKIRKREAAELENENSMSLAKKKNKRKKLVSSQDMQTNPSAGKAKAKVADVPGNSVNVPVAAEEDIQVDRMKKGDTVGTLSLPGSLVAHKMAQLKELELPQLLYDLQVLALDPFCNIDRGTSAVTQEVFLRFRSLVYQKSLASLPPADGESNESRVKPQAVVTTNNPPAAENVREQSFKPQKTVFRPDDPTKGGQKRGPSDRQEDIAAKKKKKINDMKVLTTDKKAALKTLALPRADVKETSGPTTKSIKHTPLKRPEPTSRAPEPTMLVMKFPPQGTLPSPMELKARFARFGQMDHSATRIFWKTFTCRIVYRYKADAESALRFASGNSLFGNTGVRCFIKEVEDTAPELEPVKLQREESSVGTTQSRPVVVRRMTPAPLKSQVLQQLAGRQLKSILKKSTGDEASGNGGGKGNPRVKFMLGGDENSRGGGEELMIGGNNNASFAEGGESTSHHGMDFNSKNVVVPPSTLPLFLPLSPTTAVQFPRPQNNLHYTESEPPRNAHNFNVPTAPPTTHSIPDADISQQMMTLLTKCNDVVRNLTSYLGYVPYHPL